MKLIESRLEDLGDNIQQDLDLLKKYENALRYEDDPRRIRKYRQDIERQQESAELYLREYEKLQSQIAKEPASERRLTADQLQQVHSMLVQLRSKVDNLQAGQEAVLNKLDTQHREVLARFDASDQAIVASVIKRLDESQLETVKDVLGAVEANRVSDGEINETLKAIQKVLGGVQQGAVQSSPRLAEEAASISKVLDDPKTDSSHKLKVTLPIIPLLLSYEGEIELKTGINLQSVWQGLKDRFKKQL